MKKIIGILVAVMALSSVVVAEEVAKAVEETPARKAAVEKCTKAGNTGAKLDECVATELKASAEKPAAPTAATAAKPAN
ncbi:MAG: hypothetical protein HYW02_03175 [Deltaproteobacteria bacterium]|nr:hypothetical protein [Deltaproteobacteria bacterium]MBI2500471.1 hypothetical protein [Deltaproteobacteria bacterium]